jgi:hypothetical protein
LPVSTDIHGSDTYAPTARSAPHTCLVCLPQSGRATATPDAPAGRVSSHESPPSARSRRGTPVDRRRADARPPGQRSGHTTARPDSIRSTNASCYSPPLDVLSCASPLYSSAAHTSLCRYSSIEQKMCRAHRPPAPRLSGGHWRLHGSAASRRRGLSDACRLVSITRGSRSNRTKPTIVCKNLCVLVSGRDLSMCLDAAQRL